MDINFFIKRAKGRGGHDNIHKENYIKISQFIFSNSLLFLLYFIFSKLTKTIVGEEKKFKKKIEPD